MKMDDRDKKRSVGKYFDIIKKEKIYHSPQSLKWYYEKYLFKNVIFENKYILDIGGGIGLISFYASASGASRVILLEPESDGSGSNEMEKYFRMQECLPFSEKIQLVKNKFQDFDASDMKFDIIVSHNSVNHLDENACINILSNYEAKNAYIKLFRKMYDISNPMADIIIADCSSKNFFGNIAINTPLARNVEWKKHQKPKLWMDMLMEVGYRNPKIEWTSYKQLRGLGKILFGNRMAAYYLTSHFKIHARKITSMDSIKPK